MCVGTSALSLFQSSISGGGSYGGVKDMIIMRHNHMTLLVDDDDVNIMFIDRWPLVRKFY